ncbi:MAG: helix-hairpin-helix domain-containing protein [Acidobacteriota bacterium]
MRTPIWIPSLVLLAIAAGPAVALGGERQAAAPTRASAEAPINLNTATVVELESLPGIGRRTAERIVEYRQKAGGFKKVEELMNVRGIGEKSFLRLRSLVTVAPPKADKPPAR